MLPGTLLLAQLSWLCDPVPLTLSGLSEDSDLLDGPHDGALG